MFVGDGVVNGIAPAVRNHADEAEIGRFFGHEHILTAHSHRMPAKFANFSGQQRINLAVERLVHDRDGFFVGHTQSANEFRLKARIVHRPADEFAAAVHDDGIDADRLHQHHVAHHLADQILVFHRAAADLDHEGVAAKTLQIGQRLG